jgi:hypothetical protein
VLRLKPDVVGGCGMSCTSAARRRPQHRDLPGAAQAASRDRAGYGRPLEWEELPGRQACRVADYAEGDVTQTERHDEYIDWFLDAGARFRRAIAIAHVPPATDAGQATLTSGEEPV